MRSILKIQYLAKLLAFSGFFFLSGQSALASAGYSYPFVDAEFCQKLQKSLVKSPMTNWNDDWPSAFSSDGIRLLAWKDLNPSSNVDLIRENFFQTRIQGLRSAGKVFDSFERMGLVKLWNILVLPSLRNALKINAIRTEEVSFAAPKFQGGVIHIFRYGINIQRYDSFYGGEFWAHDYIGPKYMWNYTIYETVKESSYKALPLASGISSISGELALKENFLVLLAVPKKMKRCYLWCS